MNDDLETIEESFDAIPPEVQQYIYSDEFDQKLHALFSEIAIDSQNQINFKGALFGFIAQIDDEDDIDNAINDLTENEATRKKVRDWVDVNISDKILSLITDAYVLEEEREEDEIGQSKNTAYDAAPTSLTSLANSLKQVSSSVATRRDYTIDKMPMREAPANLPISEEGVPTPAAYVSPAAQPRAVAPSLPLTDDAMIAPEPVTPTPETPSAPITKSFDPYHESIDK